MSLTNPSPEASQTPVEPSATEFADAFRVVAPELLALAREQLVVLNLDPAAAVAAVRGTLRRVAPLARLIAALPADQLDHAALAKLPLYTAAFWYAHCQYLTAMSGGPSLPELERACASHVVRLKSHLRTFVDEELLPAAVTKVVADLGTPRGYKGNALAVSALAGLLRDRWPSLVGHTALTLEALDAMARDATKLLDGAGGPTGESDPVTAALATRQRAFTLCVATYDQLRRAVSFVRWNEDDVNDFAPNLWAGRARASRNPSPDAPDMGNASDTPSPEPAKVGAPST